MYNVTLKPSHPLGTYHRSGIEFHHLEPVRLKTLTDAIRNDPWLMIEEIHETPNPGHQFLPPEPSSHIVDEGKARKGRVRGEE